ncbi:Fe-S cluster assembly sulfur transfer protein SufU [Martelella mangrovi]|uniref:Nitrogen fixation NifU-like protein n=1 Tax=Martelella mangrovi TaxID=1397477 RepID=A0ABV2ICK9_9HYPH
MRNLYQETILDHGRRPRNRRSLTGATHRARAQNPLCGDKIIAELRIDSRGRVEDAAFDGQGCAIAIASASLMTEAIKNRTLADVRALNARLQTLLSGTGPEDLDGLGDLAVLAAVRAFPSRRKCALLAWDALAAALDDA